MSKELVRFISMKYDNVTVFDEKFNFLKKGTRERIRNLYGEYICLSKVESDDDKQTNILISTELINYKVEKVSLDGQTVIE